MGLAIVFSFLFIFLIYRYCIQRFLVKIQKKCCLSDCRRSNWQWWYRAWVANLFRDVGSKGAKMMVDAYISTFVYVGVDQHYGRARLLAPFTLFHNVAQLLQ